MEPEELVKENKLPRPPLSAWWVGAALLANAAMLAAVACIDVALPEPRAPDAPPHVFSAARAHRHLINLTDIGPRVAGSYENEVLAVGVLVSAVKSIARAASPHNVVELDVHTASGGYSLAFMDGMNHLYRDVQSVVVRVRGAGARPRARSALLLNCHFDTVPDSPGASDDGAGCAVLLETLRALAAAPYPLRHDAVFLFNGAEENVLQASHAFITQHKWAKDVRAFINIEACGAGGREVLFQAGPHDPWIVEVYAGAVPHPFASSLAQELFESGLIPADTDFRIFRDFGKLSGVDLAWSANGYVYHTRLDTAERVPPAVLQRTGDNVLALAHGLLASESLESEVDESSRQPVFFDVLGLAVVSVRAPAALLLAVLAMSLVVLKIHLNATQARDELYVSRGAWWALVLRAAGGGAAAVARARAARRWWRCCCRRPARACRTTRAGWLLAPLFALPALAARARRRGRGRCCAVGGARVARRGAAAAGCCWRCARLAGCARASCRCCGRCCRARRTRWAGPCGWAGGGAPCCGRRARRCRLHRPGTWRWARCTCSCRWWAVPARPRFRQT
ncbi:unnamed protein product [Chrysodeixis includens]|uniref:FXNA-like protease n=1 Tax=Chrysodeixis includens TaxID=689277 RepID=A0A9P0FR83_CHRIL|nr:unnamed protein product [Chrysodeixis includens]